MPKRKIDPDRPGFDGNRKKTLAVAGGIDTGGLIDKSFVEKYVEKFQTTVSASSKGMRDEDKTVQNASKKVASAFGYTGVDQKKSMTVDVSETVVSNMLKTLMQTEGSDHYGSAALKVKQTMNTLAMYSDALKSCSPRIQKVIVNGIIGWSPDLSVAEDDWGGFEFEYPQEILELFFLHNKQELQVIDVLKISVKNPFVFQYYCSNKLQSIHIDRIDTVIQSFMPFESREEQNCATLFYLQYPFLNNYLVHESHMLYIATGSPRFLELIRKLKLRILSEIPNKADIVNYFPDHVYAIISTG